MKKIMLCGRPAGCCPSIQEDTKKDVIHIVDGDQKITLNKKHIRKLTKYLNKRNKKSVCRCKCASCRMS